MDKFAAWLKRNLFSSKLNSIVSIVLLTFMFKLFTLIFNWLVTDAVWVGTADQCRQASGACVVFIKEKFLFILFGFYPREELWRAVSSVLLFCGQVAWLSNPKRWNKSSLLKSLSTLFIVIWFMKGGYGLTPVSIDKWGGLPLTLMLSFIGFVFAYPMGVLLALGRTGTLPFVRVFSTVFIELVRGVPMISLLFMASVMFPLFMPEGISFPKLMRAQVAIIIFMAAYQAEVVRGGLAAVEKGQFEAADALGLSYWKKMRYIVLPQALKIVIPPTVNTSIGMFKDTSLVVIIALFDLLMTTRTSLKDPEWLGFSLEGYVFVSLIYFIFCYTMSRYARGLEKQFGYGGAS